MKNPEKTLQTSPEDEFTLQRAAMFLGVSRETLRRRLFDSDVPIIPGRKYRRREIENALTGTMQARNLAYISYRLPDGTDVRGNYP
jgi:hypothetical protein